MKRRKTSPVAKAVAKQRMGDLLRDLAIKAHLTAVGQVDRDLLAQFAFVIGIGAEVSIKLDDDLTRTKRMHSALRDLLAASVNGGVWPTGLTERLYDVAYEATELSIEHVELGMAAHPSAVYLSGRIGNGTAVMSDVVGAEIYREAA